jgi:hypothetical protein
VITIAIGETLCGITNKTHALYSIFIFRQTMPSLVVLVDQAIYLYDGRVCRNIYVLSTTPVRYLVITPSVTPIDCFICET